MLDVFDFIALIDFGTVFMIGDFQKCHFGWAGIVKNMYFATLLILVVLKFSRIESDNK